MPVNQLRNLPRVFTPEDKAVQTPQLAPNGPFYMILQVYWPKAEVLEGHRTPPPVERSA